MEWHAGRCISLRAGRARAGPYTRAVLDLPAPIRRALEGGGKDLTILVLRLGAMGDIARTLPPVRLIRAALPEARIHWVAWKPWTALLENHPDLNGVIGLPRAMFRAGFKKPGDWPSLARTTRALIREIRALDAGLALDFHGDLRSGTLGLLSKAPVSIGYEGHQAKEGNRLFSTHRVPSGGRRTPRLERNLDIVRGLGLPDRPLPDAGMKIPEADAERAAELARAFGTFAILNPGASQRQAYKKPPTPLLAAAARALAVHDIKPVIVYGPGEEGDAIGLAEACGPLAITAPPTPLMTLAALFKHARLFVGGDSGPLHLACGVGCPVVGIYGPTDPRVNTPWGVPFVIVSPPGRDYTGIKRIDRNAGGFNAIDGMRVESAVRSLVERITAA